MHAVGVSWEKRWIKQERLCGVVEEEKQAKGWGFFVGEWEGPVLRREAENMEGGKARFALKGGGTGSKGRVQRKKRGKTKGIRTVGVRRVLNSRR